MKIYTSIERQIDGLRDRYKIRYKQMDNGGKYTLYND